MPFVQFFRRFNRGFGVMPDDQFAHPGFRRGQVVGIRPAAPGSLEPMAGSLPGRCWATIILLMRLGHFGECSHLHSIATTGTIETGFFLSLNPCLWKFLKSDCASRKPRNV